MSKVFGIDISKYQKGINLATAKKEGVEFAILRAGYTGYGNGVSKAIDTEFETHYKNAKANGLGVGAYWFSRATTYENGKAEAEYMYKNCLKGKQFEYPIYIDVEDTYYQSKAGKTAITNAIKGFCEYLEGKGYYVGVYANSSWFKNYIDASIPTKYDCWVANWGTANPSSPAHGLWQFGGETNKIRTNKIAGMVCDQNYAYKDYPSIMKNHGLNGFTKAKEENKVNTPVAPKKSVETIAKEIIEAIKASGYSYAEVQTKIDELMGKSKTTTYTVKKGDNLIKIAAKYETTVEKIAKDNNIGNTNLIHIGQKLIIKG